MAYVLLACPSRRESVWQQERLNFHRFRALRYDFRAELSVDVFTADSILPLILIWRC